jgi:hypothetical protein
LVKSKGEFVIFAAIAVVLIIAVLLFPVDVDE